MININKEEGFGNDSFCTILVNAEARVDSNSFENLANGKIGEDKFELLGTELVIPQQTTDNAKYGEQSFYYNGSPANIARGIYMQATSTNYQNWEFGTKDFAIDFMLYVDTGFTVAPIFNVRLNDNNYHTIYAVSVTEGKPSLRIYWELFINGSGITNLIRLDDVLFDFDVWYHAAFVRRVIGTTDNYTIFVNGNYLTGATNSTIANIPYFSQYLEIGMRYNGLDFPVTLQNCYLDEFRISKGHYRWKGKGNIPTGGFIVRQREF